MQRCTRPLHELQSHINMGRMQLAQQFSSMDGWQSKQDTRFDQYVKDKRQKEFFDAFDQRVERAFRVAAKTHRAEVVNAFKRRLTTSNEKFSAATTMQMQTAITERLQWLRDVWAQVDADYRSQDPARQEIAAKEISAALHGEPGEYMKWVYEMKREERFLGPKGKASLQAELENAQLPEVTDEEVNRYHNLKISMSDIERNVKSKYGIAGHQHWAELQAAKDSAYEVKLDNAAKIFESLLDQNDRYEESRRNTLLRSNVQRTHEAQVRFRAAMELEGEREKLVEAHQAMKEERQKQEKQQRIELLKEAAELREKGVPSEEVSHMMRQRQMDAHAKRQAEYQLREQKMILDKKSRYLSLLDEFRTDVEEREGLELMAQGASSSSPMPQRAPVAPNEQRMRNVFGFMDDDAINAGGEEAGTAMTASAAGTSSSAATQQSGSTSSLSQPEGTASMRMRPEPHHRNKDELWKAIKADMYEDPSHTIHQARLDAEKNYTTVYDRTFPLNMRQGPKFSKQGMGENAAGNGMDGQIFKASAMLAQSLHWGVQSDQVHNMDGDGGKDYFMDPLYHVRDKETGDIDWRYEKKKGGAVFRGPRLYRMGAEREAREPGEQTMDPIPYQRGAHQAGGSGGGGSSRSPRRVALSRAPSGGGSGGGGATWRSK